MATPRRCSSSRSSSHRSFAMHLAPPRPPAGLSTRRSASRSRPPATTATSPSWRTTRSGRQSRRLLSRPAGLLLDLNGVAKALAVDASLDLIGGDGFVAAGGDVAARGGAVVGLP